MRHLTWIRGLVVWSLLATVGIWYLGRSLEGRGSSPRRFVSQLWDYSVRPRTTVQLELPRYTLLAVGDPIFVYEGGQPRRVGEVAAVRHHETGQPSHIAWVTAADVVFYPNAPPLHGCRLQYHRTPGDFAWALQTFLPPEKRTLLANELAAAFEQHQDKIVAALRPVVQQAISDAIAVVEADLPAALANHRQELQDIGARYQRDLVKQQVIPLVKEEIFPLVKQEAEPIANEVGKELWQRVSLVGFSWAYVLDRTPLLEKKNRVREKWDSFVEGDVVPVLEDHSDEIVAAVQRMVAQAMQNEKVQQVLKNGLTAMIEDQELQALVWKIVREVVIDNPKMHQALETTLRGKEAQQAFRLTGELLEPTVVRLGQIMFGSQETGIAPEFAAVLRNRVMFKDRRWLVLEGPEGDGSDQADMASVPSTLRVIEGQADAPNPFVLMLPQQVPAGASGP